MAGGKNKDKAAIKTLTREELEQQLALLMINTEESFVLVDLNLTIVSFNERFKEEYKHYFDVEVKKSASILNYALQDKEALVQLYQSVFSGKKIQCEYTTRGKDKSLHTFLLNFKPAFDETGNIMGAFVSSQNITESKRTRQALEESENRYRSIVENSLNAFILHEPDGRLLDANSAALETFGYASVEDFRNAGREGIIFYDEHLEALLARRASDGRVSGTVTGIRSNGEHFPCEFSSSVFTDMSGNKIAVSIVLDISERKKAEASLLKANAELEENKQVYQSLFYHNFSAVFALDLDGYFTSANEVLARKAETTVENILSLHYSAFVHPDDLEKVHSNFDMAKHGTSREYEIRIINAKQKIITILLINLPIIVNGVIVGVYGIANDITQERQSQFDLERSLEEREKLNQELILSNNELEQFAYIASHDLQEPLRMITGFLQLLEKKYKDNIDETAAKYIWYAVDGAVRMRKIISDLLEYSRVGRQQYEFDDIDTNDLVKEVLQLNQQLVEENNVVITCSGLPVVRAARTPLQQVFHNLINNAIKYKQDGRSPVIEIQGKDLADRWEFAITDNGIGIEKNFYETIFIIFQRIHPKNEYTGSGIGLAICKKIINNHGGKISVESTPGVGSVFYFSIAK